MRQYTKFLIIVTSVIIALSGCNRIDESESDFENVAYIESAKNVKSELIGLRNKDIQVEREIQSSLALPTNKDVHITYKVDESLVSFYNVTNYAQCEMLPAEFFELSDTKAVVLAGEVRSTPINVIFKDLQLLPRGAVFILPVSIDNASDMNVLSGSKTFYYLLKKGAPITTAANIGGTALWVPTMATTGVASGLKTLNQLTMEALVYMNEWGTEAGISSFMGIESYFLMRFGDSNYEDQMQVAAASFGGNWPAKDGALRLPKGKWIHIALTYDLTTHEMILYANGKVQAKTTQGSANVMDLTRSTGVNPTNRFHIGKSWNDNRSLHGQICEARIWNVVRTQDELIASKYEVNPATTGLVAYWKFDEGAGNTILDHTGNGNDLGLALKEGGLANNPITWVPVELGGE